jgi:branched-chain amino acid transport system permease protein
MKFLDRTLIGLALAFVLLMVANLFMADWVHNIALPVIARGSVALGLLVLWRTGLISFGHALYFGCGAYTAALLTKSGITDALVLTILSVLSAGLLAYVLGFLLRRYRGIFFALLNMAFSMILYGLIVRSEALGSTDGFGVSSPTYFGFKPETAVKEVYLFGFTLCLTFAIVVAVHLYLRSTLGHMTMAVRENEIRVEYLGFSAEKAIHIKYVISGLLAGFGGVIMALSIGQVDPESMANWLVSGEFVFITILSGTGSVAATYVGALVFELIRVYAFEYFPYIWQMILGGVLLGFILFLPDGLWSLRDRLRKALGAS